MKVITTAEGQQGLTIRVSHSMKYVNEFLRLKCAPDLLARLPKAWDAKEISESLGVMAAIRRHMGRESLADPDVVAVDVGCGAAGRTAALIACLTRWTVCAVDPVLRGEPQFMRLRFVKERVENLLWIRARTVVVVACHAHISLAEALETIDADRILVVAVPCCKPLELDYPPHYEHEDPHILSPKRTVKVWDITR